MILFISLMIKQPRRDRSTQLKRMFFNFSGADRGIMKMLFFVLLHHNFIKETVPSPFFI